MLLVGPYQKMARFYTYTVKIDTYEKVYPTGSCCFVAGQLRCQKSIKTISNGDRALGEDSARLANHILSLTNNIAGLNSKIDNLNNQNNQLGQQTANQQNQLANQQVSYQKASWRFKNSSRDCNNCRIF